MRDPHSPDQPKARRGFALMAPELRREIAARGGRAVPPALRSFSKDREFAKTCGQQGGLATPPEKRSFKDRELASRAGRKSAEARARIAIAATVAGEGLALVLFLAGLWAVMFLIPWDEAYAASSMPDDPRGFIAHMAFAGGLISIVFALACLIWAFERRVCLSLSRRRVRKAAERAELEAQIARDLEPIGDASLYGRRP